MTRGTAVTALIGNSKADASKLAGRGKAGEKVYGISADGGGPGGLSLASMPPLRAQTATVQGAFAPAVSLLRSFSDECLACHGAAGDEDYGNDAD